MALSVLCWSFSGLFEVYFSEIADGKPVFLDGFRSIFSLCNSLFILLALPWFRYLPESLENIIKSKYWRLIIGLPFLFSFLPTLNKIIFEKEGIINELDVYYAVLTLIFLGLVLWHSFSRRRLVSLAYLSLICIGITLLAQIYKLTGSTINLTLFSAIFKTCLIMIFFALALSWVKELSENVIPSSERIGLGFESKRRNDTIERSVIFEGFLGGAARKVSLTTSQYDLMYHFAETRKNEEAGWLEIKPRNSPKGDKQYDINDYNEVKRLLIVLLDGLFGKGNWSKENHLEPLKNTLFELSKKRERKIRLNLLPENIQL